MPLWFREEIQKVPWAMTVGAEPEAVATGLFRGLITWKLSSDRPPFVLQIAQQFFHDRLFRIPGSQGLQFSLGVFQ